jgi:hypothetical protein
MDRVLVLRGLSIGAVNGRCFRSWKNWVGASPSCVILNQEFHVSD